MGPARSRWLDRRERGIAPHASPGVPLAGRGPSADQGKEEGAATEVTSPTNTAWSHARYDPAGRGQPCQPGESRLPTLVPCEDMETTPEFPLTRSHDGTDRPPTDSV